MTDDALGAQLGVFDEVVRMAEKAYDPVAFAVREPDRSPTSLAARRMPGSTSLPTAVQSKLGFFQYVSERRDGLEFAAGEASHRGARHSSPRTSSCARRRASAVRVTPARLRQPVRALG